NLGFWKYVNREFDSQFGVVGQKIGYVYNARVPVRFRGRIGDGLRPEDIRETVVPITLNRLWGCDLDISDQDLTLTIDRFGERYIEPAVAIIANRVDGEGLDQFVNVFNVVGIPGTVPTSLSTYVNAGVQLDNMATPENSMLRSAIVNPAMQGAILGFGSNL